MSETASLRGAEIAHQVRGRVRLKLAYGADDPTTADRVRAVFASMPGFDDSDVRPGSSSVVVTYDPDRHDDVVAFLSALPLSRPVAAPPKVASKGARKNATPRPSKRAAATPGPTSRANGHRPPKNEIEEKVEAVEEEAEFLAEHSHTARVIVDFAKDLDTRIKQATNNNLDLKILVPVGLAAVAIIEVGAAAATPMWVTLALFSLNHFVELHAHDGGADEDDDDDEAGYAEPDGEGGAMAGAAELI